MSSREGTGRFHEPEVGSTSGGRLAPDSASGPLFDPLDAPLPSERARRAPTTDRVGDAGRASPERTEQLPSRSGARSSGEPGQKTAGASRQQVRRRSGIRRVRRTVRHVDPFSVLKLSGFFYAIFVLVWLLFVAVVYSLLDSMGLFKGIEDFGGPDGMALWEDLNITLGLFEKWALLIGIVLGVIGTLVNTLLAVLYNVGSDLLGGLELTFVEKDS